MVVTSGAVRPELSFMVFQATRCRDVVTLDLLMVETQCSVTGLDSDIKLCQTKK